MSEPEIDANSTNEILKELRTFTKEIRDLLRQKAVQGNGTTQQINEASLQGEDSPEVGDATAHQTLSTETANVETDDMDYGTNDSKIAEYKMRCAKHRSECMKMQVELGCFVAHLRIVRGDEEVIEKTESLRNYLLDPVQCLEKALDATRGGGLNVMEKVKWSFNGLHDFVLGFAGSPQQTDTLYPDKAEQWRKCTHNGWIEIDSLVHYGKFAECLEFIHDFFFSELETAMGGVVEALTTFEEKSVSEWLAKQKIGDFERWSKEYISCVFSPLESVGATSASPDPGTVALLKGRFPYQQSLCVKIGVELDHLIAHYDVVGGDKEVIEAAKVVQSCLLSLVEEIKRAVTAATDGRASAMNSLLSSLGRLYLAAGKFKESLYHQKHAFYFREVKKWVVCLLNGLHAVHGYMHCNEWNECLNYVCDDLFTNLEVVMIGLSVVPKETKLYEGYSPGASSGNVAEELKMFGKESLPKLLVDQMERDTTRYINLTTIATFFSSVTATTLQFTYAETDAVPSNSVRGVVNLFWFLSLVFSVSSGVSSLLGLTWRKSSIYDSRVPPKLIRLWFDKAPMLFLIIAAVAFVIGLNLFSYLSLQPLYVSFATNFLTGLLGTCLLAVTTWFIYQLKRDSAWAKWIRKVLQWIGGLRVWTWIGNAWTWIEDLLISIWRWIRYPRQQYREKKLHLQRNFFWAFGTDNRVALLNSVIDWGRDWPGPYLLSKLIRRIANTIKRCWLMAKKARSGLRRSVRAHICGSCHTVHTEDDIEMGEVGISSESLVKNEFCKSLQTVFSEADCVDRIMEEIDFWVDAIINNDPSIKKYFNGLLWGYTDLVGKLFDVFGPALAREREEARRQVMTNVYASNNNLFFASEVWLYDKTPQPIPSAQPDDESGPLVISQTDAQLDTSSQGQPDDHPPTLDERALLTTTENTKALKPASGGLTPQPDIGEGATSTNETEEVPSTLENYDGATCIAQNEKESGE